MSDAISVPTQSATGHGTSPKPGATAASEAKTDDQSHKTDLATLRTDVPHLKSPHFRQTPLVPASVGKVATPFGNIAGLMGNVAALFVNVSALLFNVSALFGNVSHFQIVVTPPLSKT